MMTGNDTTWAEALNLFPSNMWLYSLRAHLSSKDDPELIYWLFNLVLILDPRIMEWIYSLWYYLLRSEKQNTRLTYLRPHGCYMYRELWITCFIIENFVHEYPKVVAIKAINGTIAVSYQSYLDTYCDFIKYNLWTGLGYNFVVIRVDKMLRFSF